MALGWVYLCGQLFVIYIYSATHFPSFLLLQLFNNFTVLAPSSYCLLFVFLYFYSNYISFKPPPCPLSLLLFFSLCYPPLFLLPPSPPQPSPLPLPFLTLLLLLHHFLIPILASIHIVSLILGTEKWEEAMFSVCWLLCTKIREVW